MSVELDQPGEALWRLVEEQWLEQARHDAFVQYCFATGRLTAAAARYAGRLETRPEDEMARRMRERVLFLSMQALAAATPRPGARRFMSSPWFVVVVLLGAALGAALGIIYGARL
jgi:hypothetical protein